MDEKLRREMEEFKKFNSDFYRRNIRMNFYFDLESAEENMQYAYGELEKFIRREVNGDE